MKRATALCARMALLLGLGLAGSAIAQTLQAPAAAPADAAAAPAAPAGQAGVLAPLAWLHGCWLGNVNKREFRETWLPQRGELMVGVSHTVMEGKTLGFEYLRLENRPDGIYYVTGVPGQKETGYKLVDTRQDQADVTYTFANPAEEFPQKIAYRRGPEGWLYATVEGKVGGADRSVIYPMRRIGCESGEVIRK